jgi:hypothetical protein
MCKSIQLTGMFIILLFLFFQNNSEPPLVTKIRQSFYFICCIADLHVSGAGMEDVDKLKMQVTLPNSATIYCFLLAIF